MPTAKYNYMACDTSNYREYRMFLKCDNATNPYCGGNDFLELGCTYISGNNDVEWDPVTDLEDCLDRARNDPDCKQAEVRSVPKIVFIGTGWEATFFRYPHPPLK